MESPDSSIDGQSIFGYPLVLGNTKKGFQENLRQNPCKPQEHMNQVGKTKWVEVFEADSEAAEIADNMSSRNPCFPTKSWSC
jgi:hypothetical protein